MPNNNGNAASTAYKEAYERELVRAMREAYVPPHVATSPNQYPDALVGPPHPRNKEVLRWCDEAMKRVREYKMQEDDEISRKQILTELFICCEALEALGYKATAGIGSKRFVYAHRVAKAGGAS